MCWNAKITAFNQKLAHECNLFAASSLVLDVRASHDYTTYFQQVQQLNFFLQILISGFCISIHVSLLSVPPFTTLVKSPQLL